MIRLVSLLVGYLLCFYTVFARQPKSAEKQLANNKSLLWKISGNHLQKPSYIFGTIHLLCKNDYIWTPAMKNALRKADEACFEMDMDDQTVLLTVASGMMDMSGKSLKDRFSESDYKIIEHFIVDSLGMNMALLQQMKPIALQSLFATKAVNCDNPVSYEMNIMDEAKKQKKTIGGLEEAREQMELFDNMPEDSVVKELVAMAKDYSKEKKEYASMLAAYKKQDLPALYQAITMAEASGEDMSQLLDERNKKWIERMEDKMEQKSVFFAVGAGHLWGPNGVIELLRARGYVVEPLR